VVRGALAGLAPCPAPDFDEAANLLAALEGGPQIHPSG
jgi:hypothetical protein